jgi:hypothetical protein
MGGVGIGVLLVVLPLLVFAGEELAFFTGLALMAALLRLLRAARA